MLLTIIYSLNKKNKYVDEANMWHKLAVTDARIKLHYCSRHHAHYEHRC